MTDSYLPPTLEEMARGGADNTQSGSDIIVTRKDTPTEVEADKIKDTQAEQSAKTAHTTQAELDEILEDFYDGDIRQSDMGKAKYAILDWHNKQVEEVLDRASNILTGSDDFRIKPGVSLDLTIGQIRAIRLVVEAERNKLKESK